MSFLLFINCLRYWQGNSASCARSTTVNSFAWQCHLFRAFCFNSLRSSVGEQSLWTAVVSPWLHFQMASPEDIKKVVRFGRSSELAASHWLWQLQGSADPAINRERWASQDALALELRSWVEAKGREGRQWETWEQLFSCSSPQGRPLAIGALHLKENDIGFPPK